MKGGPVGDRDPQPGVIAGLRGASMKGGPVGDRDCCAQTRRPP